MAWLLTCLLLSLFLWLTGAAALALWPVQLVSNLVELALLPGSIMAGMLFPPAHFHPSAAFYLARACLAGFGYGTLLWVVRTGWRTVRSPLQSGRRLLLLRATLLATFGTALYSVLIEPNWLHLRRYEVEIPDLPPELDGFKLGHLSDTHYGPLIGLGHIRRAIGLLNAEQPDLIVHTGDFVHHTPAAIPEGIGVMSACRARLGTLAVLGNHDHWEGAPACRAELARHNLRLLDNDRVFVSSRGLQSEPGPDCLAICGVGDLWEGVVDPDRALREVPDGCPRILMSHNPDVAELIEPRHRFHLQLSGHTHGGQVSFPGVGPTMVPSRYGARYAGGLVQGPHWPVLISRGVGMVMIPVRFRVPPEVSLITLRRLAT